MALHSSALAQVYTSNRRPYTFLIVNGTCQSCPIPPFILNLLIESLAETIHANSEISRFIFSGKFHKINLLTDDVILLLTNPTTSILVAHCILTYINHISYYKVNSSKSLVLNLGLYFLTRAILKWEHPYTWCDSDIPYLGIILTSDTVQLAKVNYMIPIDKLTKQSMHITRQELPWSGHLASFKMVLLPQSLYPFHTLPIPRQPVHLPTCTP